MHNYSYRKQTVPRRRRPSDGCRFPGAAKTAAATPISVQVLSALEFLSWSRRPASPPAPVFPDVRKSFGKTRAAKTVASSSVWSPSYYMAFLGQFQVRCKFTSPPSQLGACSGAGFVQGRCRRRPTEGWVCNAFGLLTLANASFRQPQIDCRSRK
jgi:hypothetical protein